MKIVQSVISMKSHYEFQASYTKTETLREWRDAPAQSAKQPSRDSQVKQWLQDQLKISEEAKKALQKEQCGQAKGVSSLEEDWAITDHDHLKILILEKMLSAITGRRIKFRIPEKINLEACPLNIQLPPQGAASGAANAQGPGRLGWGLSYESTELYRESECLSFTAQGTVKTADGKEINIGVQVRMSREFAASNQISFKAGDALLDPLVINFDRAAAELGNAKFQFDLDADGTPDQISFLQEGSGFLAIDKSGDGVINDGTELFGPSSGNGFGELAAYDHDLNGWIDENDPIFNKLRIWTKDSLGKDYLFALGQKGIGAIYLGNISSPFSLKDQTNQLNGMIRETGLFLRENGAPGTIQQIDLVV
ncbi:MAG: hypothetical protein K6U80_06145 [Firmicutes bacterium]|nr:hypothetical protein [Bacillota bacterium]